jgi:hypothetical protein
VIVGAGERRIPGGNDVVGPGTIVPCGLTVGEGDPVVVRPTPVAAPCPTST